MRIRILGILVFTVLSACGGGSSSSGASSSKENQIIVLGDSIGYGWRASVRFPDILQNLVGIPVLNISKPGINAEQGVAAAPGLIKEHNPRYLAVLLGTNNALGAGGEVEGAIRTMEDLAQICEETATVCILGTLPPITASSNENNAVNQINAGYLGLAGGRIRIADSNSAMNGSHLNSDGIHPNNSGQQVIAETFAAQLP